ARPERRSAEEGVGDGEQPQGARRGRRSGRRRHLPGAAGIVRSVRYVAAGGPDAFGAHARWAEPRRRLRPPGGLRPRAPDRDARLPSAALRERAELSLDCEVKEAHACLQLARIADAAKDAKEAQEFLDRACAAGGADACAEAGDRWLSGDARDPARAISALQRGCDSSNAAACVRLARAYEEGDGTAPNAKAGTDLREKACAAGDGKSCRRLAGVSDEPGHIADLLRKGCDGGDSMSCAL